MAREPKRRRGRAGEAGVLAALPPAEFPLTVAIAGETGAYGDDEHHQFVLDRFVSGLAEPADAP